MALGMIAKEFSKHWVVQLVIEIGDIKCFLNYHFTFFRAILLYFHYKKQKVSILAGHCIASPGLFRAPSLAIYCFQFYLLLKFM